MKSLLILGLVLSIILSYPLMSFSQTSDENTLLDLPFEITDEDTVGPPESNMSIINDGNNTATITIDTAGLAGNYVFWIEASDGTEYEREPYTVTISP